MTLEICSTSVLSTRNAESAGAHRIELCTELAVGGITPSYGFIKQTLNATKLPVFVLIRPRSGNFTYSEEEFEIMKADILQCKNIGCAGIVSGVLNKDNTLDIERTKTLIELSKPLPFTFHRAFDWVENPLKTLEQLIELGASRILTSGQQPSAEKGLDLLIHLKEKANSRITILPGGGIHPENAILFKQNGFQEIHASASDVFHKTDSPKIPMNSPKFFDETTQYHSDTEKIKAILNAIKNEKV